jgi:hypothetical protein
MHALALVAFSTDSLFVGQEAHPPDILSGNVPEEHPRQSVAPAMLLVPSAQSTHPEREVMPGLLEYFPGGHFKHMLRLDARKTDEYAPAGHSVHTVLPLVDVYDPGSHPLQLVGNDGSDDASPAGQRVHLDAPVEFAKLPIGHVTHPVDDWFSANAPIGHSVHPVRPGPSLNAPALHLVHRSAPCVSVNWPCAHFTHAPSSDVPRLEFPNFPAPHCVHPVELTRAEKLP